MNRLYSLILLAGIYSGGCRPKDETKVNPPDQSQGIEKIVSNSKKDISDIVKVPKSPPFVQEKNNLEDYINKSGTRFSKVYHRTRPDKLPKINITGFYNLLDDELGLKIEKEYENENEKTVKNDVKLIKKIGEKKLIRIIVEHKGESEGVSVINYGDKEAFFFYDKGRIILGQGQIEKLFSNSYAYREAYFMQLEADVKNVMPLLKLRKEELEGKAKEEFERAISLATY